MNGKKYLLDTNVIVDFFSGDQAIKAIIEPLGELIVSSITMGELYFGVEKSMHKSRHLKQVEEFTDLCTILEIDLATAKMYGVIKNELKKKGHPIPENDLWIAATSIQHDLILISKDKHFTEIEELDLKEIV